MIQEQVPIGTVKRDISELVNRVAFGSERIVLTSRGKPKAALISIEDLEQLEQGEKETQINIWTDILEKQKQLNEQINSRRDDEPIDIETLWRGARDDLAARPENNASS